MNIVIIKTQAEWDALPQGFRVETKIEIRSNKNIWLQILRIPKNSHAVMWENSHAEMWENSHAEMWENSHAVMRGNSHAVMRGNSHAEMWGNSHAVMRGNSHAVMRENSHAEMGGNSHAVMRGNSYAVMRENSHAVMWGNSHAEMWGNSHAVMRGNSHAVMRENSNAVMWENSHAEMWENSVSHVQGVNVEISLFCFAVVFLLAKAEKVAKKSSTSTVITVEKTRTLDEWLNYHGMEGDNLIVYKRVSKDLKTQENTCNETVWSIGKTLKHSYWDPTKQECGEGKYHACPKAFFCDEFRNEIDDKYIAISVVKEDLYSWPEPEYQHKIAFRKGTVLYECDRYGNKIA